MTYNNQLKYKSEGSLLFVTYKMIYYFRNTQFLHTQSLQEKFVNSYWKSRCIQQKSNLDFLILSSTKQCKLNCVSFHNGVVFCIIKKMEIYIYFYILYY